MRFKETEIGTIPEHWEVVKLGEAFDVQQGKQLSSKEDVTGKILKPFLRTSNVMWNRIDVSNISYMYFSQQEFKKLKLQDGDILICEGGDVGRTAIWKNELEECAYQNHIHRLRPKDKRVVNYFFSYWIEHAIKILKIFFNDANKTTIPNLSSSRLKAFSIPLPPLEEQKKIAGVLSAVQSAKEKVEEVIKATRELKKSLMRHLFTYGPVPLNEIENVKLKETEIGQIPEHWEVGRFGENGKFQYGYTTTSTTKRTGIKLLRITDIKDDLTIDWTEVPYADIEEKVANKYKLSFGNILFARIGATTGKACMIKENVPNAIFGSYLIRFISENNLNPIYAFYFTQTNVYWVVVNTIKDGKLKKGLSSNELKNFPIPIPPLFEQKMIAEILTAVDEKIQAEENKKKALEILFKSLLHNLMTGKIRVNHLNLEV